MKARTVSVMFLVAVVVQLIWAATSFAIPAFSRQHKTECTTCHTIYPELNEYGEAFRKNGYVWFGRGPAGATSPQGAVKPEGEGNESSKGKVPEGLWLAAIPEQLPVSLTASFDLAYDDHPANDNKFDLSTRSVVLQAGGAFRDKAGFFLTYNAYTQNDFRQDNNSKLPANNSPDISELFLVWRHALNSPLNVKVGRFQPQLTLWKRSNKLSVADLAPTAYVVGLPTPANNTSQFTVDTEQDALEVNTLAGNRVFIAGGVVNRKRQNTKEGYGHVSCKLGGADFAGHEPAIDLDSENIWDFLSVTLGAYGYSGRDRDTSFGGASNFNNYYRAGLDMDLLYKQFRLRFSGVKGRDTNPDFASRTEIRSFVLASAADYMFDTNLIGTFRYEYQDDGSGISRRYIPTIVYAPLQNIKLTLEYQYDDKSPYVGQDIIDRKALLGIRFGL
jgi:hypothetical protein